MPNFQIFVRTLPTRRWRGTWPQNNWRPFTFQDVQIISRLRPGRRHTNGAVFCDKEPMVKENPGKQVLQVRPVRDHIVVLNPWKQPFAEAPYIFADGALIAQIPGLA